MEFWAVSSAPRHCLSSRTISRNVLASRASSRNLRRPDKLSAAALNAKRPRQNPYREIGACDEHLWDDHIKSIGQDARFPGHFYCCAFCSDQRDNNCGTVRPSFNLTIDAIGTIGGCCRGARRLEQ